MKIPPSAVNPSVQLPLIPPEVVELHLRVGIADMGNHVQMQLEVWDASGGHLIDMRSHPSVSEHHVGPVLDELCEQLRKLTWQAIRPF